MISDKAAWAIITDSNRGNNRSAIGIKVLLDFTAIQRFFIGLQNFEIV